MSTLLFKAEPVEQPGVSFNEVQRDGDEISDDMVVEMSPAQAQLQRFPIGASVLFIKDARPFPKVVFGVVQTIGLNLMSRERENVFTVQGQSGPVLAREADLQFVSQTRVWCDNRAALVLSSSQDSILAPARYTVHIVDGELLRDVGIDRLTFRMESEKGLTVTRPKMEHSAGRVTKSEPPVGHRKVIPTEQVTLESRNVQRQVAPGDPGCSATSNKPRPTHSAPAAKKSPSNCPPTSKGQGTADANEQLVIELLDSDGDDDMEIPKDDHERKKKRPSLIARWEPPSKQAKIQNRQAAITCSTAKARNFKLGQENRVYRCIVLPSWVDTSKIKERFQPFNCLKGTDWQANALERQTRCEIWLSRIRVSKRLVPGKREKFGVGLHIEGDSRDAVHKATLSVLEEASRSVQHPADLCRFLFDVAMANKDEEDFARIEGHAAWMVLPPDFATYGWMATVLLPSKCYERFIGLFIGVKGNSIKQLEEATMCKLVVCKSETPHIAITGTTSEDVNRAVDEVRIRLQRAIHQANNSCDARNFGKPKIRFHFFRAQPNDAPPCPATQTIDSKE